VLDWLLHLWAAPPDPLEFSPCPPAPPGGQADPIGNFDPETVSAAFTTAGVASAVAVLLVVLLCYLATSKTLSPGFVKRWWLFGGLASLLAAIVPAAVLRLWPTRAAAESCTTLPTAFPLDLPWDIIIERAVAGLIWGAFAYVILSLLLTKTLGRFPAAGGLFHNRGCPHPRFRPS